MKKTFSEDDVARWARKDKKYIPFTVEKIRAGEVRAGLELAVLSREHELAALTQLALGNYQATLGHFSAAAGAWTEVLRRYNAAEALDEDLISRTSIGPILLANASGDAHSIDQLASEYAFPDARSGKNLDHWLGMIGKLLTMGDVESASQWLHSVPKLESSEDRVLVGLLDAIASQDAGAFAQGLGFLTLAWQKRIRSERLQKFPDAVCDHYQIGWVRLAERVWERRPDVDLSQANIPMAVLDAAPGSVEGTL